MGLSSLLNRINDVDASDPRGRQAYLTRVLSITLLLVLLPFTPVALAGWLLGYTPGDTLLILLGGVVVLGGVLALSWRRYCPVASFALPLLAFIAAGYGNAMGGAQAPAMVIYALAITVAAILQGTPGLLLFLLLSLLSFLGFGMAQHLGLYLPHRSWATVFENRMIVFSCTLCALALSLWLLKSLYERAIREAVTNRERYRQLVMYAPAGIWEVDFAEGRFISVNDAMCELLGYSREELLQIHPLDLLSEASRRLFEERLSDMQNGRPVTDTVRYEVVKKSGERLWMMLNCRFIKKNGMIAEAHVVAQNVTEIQEAEDALRKSEKKFKDLAELLPQVLFEIQSDGRIAYVNRAGLELFGCSSRDMEEGLFARDLIAPDDRERFAADMTSVMTGNRCYGTEYLAEKKSGPFFPVMAYAAPIEEDRRFVGLRGVLLDMTDRKRMESQLIQAQKMEAIGTLAGGMAHDFNNLLMGIQGCTSLMLLDLSPSHPHYERLRQIEQQVQSGAHLTRQLLGFARGGRYDVKPTDMNDLILRASTLFERTHREIAVHHRLAEDLMRIKADEGQMEQVLLNLYINAAQAMRDGGTLTVETANVPAGEGAADVAPASQTPWIRISITDTGQGMDPKTCARIFEPFFTTRAMGRGTGLGLAMVYGIIGGHGGTIRVDSEPGRGTTFVIHLPSVEDTSSGKGEKTVPFGEMPRGKEAILVIDDEPLVLKICCEILQALGYEVYGAACGLEALNLLESRRREFDLVILDMVMPGLSGEETFDRLRAVAPALRILLASGYSIEGQARKLLERGCNGFIQKPYRVETLSRKIREILG